MWSDFFGPSVGTGFGTVSRHIAKIFKDIYEIDQLAINYNGEFFDNKEWPIQVSPAKLLDPKDPYGTASFLQTVSTGKYDYVWIMNDTFVVTKTGKQLQEVLDNLAKQNKKVPVIIYYFPIDCVLAPGAEGMLETADICVAYTEFARKEVLKRVPHIAHKLVVIPHGSNQADFRRLPFQERAMLRDQLLRVKDPDTFVWMNCNRNSIRKDIAKTMYVFSEFKKKIPDSKLYLHTAIRDTNMDLTVPLRELGLKPIEDVIFPSKYQAHRPLNIEVLNGFYNAADAFITTALGGGFELTTIEAACVGLPIIAPSYTCFPEQFEGRAWLYPCKEKIYIDQQGFRQMGRSEDILEQMFKLYEDVKSNNHLEKVRAASQYVESISWNRIAELWKDLFRKAESLTPTIRKIEAVKI